MNETTIQGLMEKKELPKQQKGQVPNFRLNVYLEWVLVIKEPVVVFYIFIHIFLLGCYKGMNN